MTSIRYVICDVFTDKPLSGNQLAVFTQANDLSPALMQRLAREMNFSESTFVQRAASGGHARVRIFTPTQELPFAGHPVLGTAFVLAEPLQTELLRLETGKGIITVRLEREGPRVVFGWMSQPHPTISPFAQGEELLRALGVPGAALPLEIYENGPQHLAVYLGEDADLGQLRPDLTALARAFPGCIDVFAGSGSEYRLRVFAPAAGINEDPATGSAVGPLALHLARHGVTAFGSRLRFSQGRELGRDSELFAEVHGSRDSVQEITVGGAAVIVARGEFRLVRTSAQ